MKKRMFCFLICFSVILSHSFLPAQNIPKYIIKAWTIEDGLPQNSVLSLIQTRDGYIWFGTELGLVRFNGINFKVFNRWNTEGLKNNRVVSIYEDSDASLWIGTDGGGISRYKDGCWNTFRTHDGLSSNHVRFVYGDRYGNIWIGTSRGLNQFVDKTFRVYTTDDGLFDNSITAVYRDQKGNLWIATEKGLNLKNEEVFPGKHLFNPVLNEPITTIYEDQSGIIWIGTENGLKWLKEGKILTYTTENGLCGNFITAITEDKSKNLWIGTYGDGICRMKNRDFSHFSTASGLTDDFIHSILEDQEGNLWIGTYAGGMIRMKSSIVSTISKESGLPEENVSTVLKDRDGFLWIGTKHRGFCKYKNGRILKKYTLGNGLSSNHVTSLFKSTEGDLWIGTRGGGLNRLRNDKISIFSIREGMNANDINVIVQDSNGSLWIGTPNGLNRIKYGKNFDVISEIEEFTGSFVRVVYEDQKGNLWIGSKERLSRIKGGIIRHFELDGMDQGCDVLSIYTSPQSPEVLWIGTNGRGLLRLEDGKLTRYTDSDGLYSNYIFSITETGGQLIPKDSIYGNNQSLLWMSSYSGVFRVPLEQLNKFSSKMIDSVTSSDYTETDGMRSSECVGGTQPSSWKTRDETLYFPTVKGIAVFNAQAVKINKKSPPVVIEDVIINNRSFINKKDIKISDGKHMFEFYFAALSFTSPHKVKFKYKLEGFEKKWVNLDSRQKQVALYLNLDPGKYVFHVIACNSDGIWNEEGTRFPFVIQSDLSLEKIILWGGGLLLLVLFGGFFLFKYRILIKKDRKKYQTSALTSDRAEDILKKLLKVMKEEKIYLDPDLTLKKLSEKLFVHYNHLSQIVNDQLNQSFNDFVNNYRIAEAKFMLKDPEESEKTILEIAYDVGFYSKSVFNTAFKKFTGLTPSQFRKENLKKHS